MKRLNKIVLALSILVTLYSCTNETVSQNQFVLLQKVVEVANDGTSTTTLLHYNGNKIVSIDGAAKRSNFTYTNDLITKIIEFDKKSQIENTLDYTYFEGKLLKVNSSNNYVINFVHNANGTVSYEKVTKDSSNNSILIFSGILYFQNENVTKDERIIYDAGVGVLRKNSATLEYDYKNNPLKNIEGYSKLLDHFNSISSNNTVSIFEVSSDEYKEGQVTSSAHIDKMSYKYDGQDYPVEMVSNISIFGNETIDTIKSSLYY